MKKFKYNIIFISIVFALLLVYIFFIDDPKMLFAAVKSTKIAPFIIAAVFMCLYWVFETLAQYFIIKSAETPLKFHQVLRVVMIGQLFNCLTPSATGGQPVQMYEMGKYGSSAGKSACVLLMRFLIYQAVMVFYSAVIILAKLSFFKDKVSNLAFISLIGFAVNAAVLVGLFLCCFFPKGFAKAANKFIMFLGKIKIIKNPKKITDKIDAEISQFHTDFKAFSGKKAQLIMPAVFSFLQLTCFFIIPFFVCECLGVKINPINALCAAGFTFMISSFVPLPGGSGGAEGGFLLFFGSDFSAQGKSVALAILLWRILTFYLPIVSGSIFSFIKNKKNKKPELSA